MDFLRKIADASPLPAGGAAVAYSLGLAIGLLNKITLLEMHRRADQPDLEKNLLSAKSELERLLKDVEQLVKQDAESFQRFLLSRKSGDEDKIAQEFNGVIKVSMKVMQNSDAAFGWIQQLHGIIPKWLTPHLLVATELIMGSINGSVHVVRANLQLLNTSEKKNNYLKKLTELHQGNRKKYSIILEKLLQEPQ